MVVSLTVLTPIRRGDDTEQKNIKIREVLMNNKFIRGAVGFAAVSAITLSGGMAFAKDAISIAVPSFLTGGAAGPFGIPAMNGAKMVADAINAGKLPAPYNTKVLGEPVQRSFLLMKVEEPRSRLLNIETLSKKEMSTRLLAIFPREIVRLWRQLLKSSSSSQFLRPVAHPAFLKRQPGSMCSGQWVMRLPTMSLQLCT